MVVGRGGKKNTTSQFERKDNLHGYGISSLFIVDGCEEDVEMYVFSQIFFFERYD